MNIHFRIFLIPLVLLWISGCADSEQPKITQKQVIESKIEFWVGDTTNIIHGIDVSHHQDTIDWNKVKNFGVTFIFVKATEGIDYRDTMFTHNWRAIEKENMIRGAYHFYESDDDPIQQANWFVNNVKSFDGVLPPVIDVERAGHKKVTVEEYQKNLEILLTEVEKLTGRQPLIYSSPNFAAKYLSDNKFGKYKLWIAEYGVDEPRIPPAWQNEGWHFWQDSYQTKIPGVDKPVDRNRFANKYSELLNMLK